jgi:hypothetical protein
MATVADAVAAPVAPRMAAGGSETVLVVEDNDAVRALAHDVLVRRGYRVLEAPNGEDGLHLALAHLDEVRCVISDVVMPIMGGRELAMRLVAVQPQLKFIFTSGYTDDAITRQGALIAGSAFLQKPFSPEALGRLVRSVLDDESVKG